MDKILIVDDDFFVLEQLKSLLSNKNRDISFVAKAELAILRMEKEQFDLILLDVNMPGINGIELLKKIRKSESHNDIPVIMITGDDDTATFVNCFKNGANDYIEKPINTIILNSRVNAAINSRKQIKENLEKSVKISDFQIQLERQKSIQHQLRSLVSRMNPHFIFNILNSIQFHVLENEQELALEGISGFSKLIRTSLNQSEKDLIFLDEELDFLNNYLFLEQNRLGEKLQFNITTPKEILEDEIMVPPMIIQPFVENSIVHGISNLKEGGIVAVIFSTIKDYLMVEINDNGIGREKAALLKTQRRGSKYQSKAQSIIDLRMQMFSELHKKKFTYEIIDLFNEKNISIGTSVKLKIPIDLEE